MLRNFVRMAARARAARRDREARAAADPAEPGPTPEMLLERAEAQRSLVGLVVALEEPFRTTVLLRYFEGLDASEIARVQVEALPYKVTAFAGGREIAAGGARMKRARIWGRWPSI